MNAKLRSVILAVFAASATAANAEPLGTGFSFQGQLKEGNRLVDELIDMQFTLYDAAVDGSAVSLTLVFDGQPGNQPSVDVVKGSFSVGLDFGSDVFDGSALWVQVEVRPHDPSDLDPYSPLSPRQLASATPYALQTRGVFVDGAGNVGIGTNAPTSKLEVNGTVTATAFVGDGSGLSDLPPQGAVWQPNGNDAFYSAGGVGIGTAGPILPGEIVTGSIMLNGTLPTPTTLLAAATDPVTGKVYFFGGESVGVGIHDQIYEFDPTTNQVTIKTATLPTPRLSLAVVASPTTGKIYCFGGNSDQNAQDWLDEILEYDPASDTLTVMAATLPSGRHRLAAAVDPATGKIFCFGGQSVTGTLDEIIEYDPATDSVTVKSATLPTGREHLAAAASPLTGKIYCFGGNDGLFIDEIVEYDPESDTVTIRSETLPTGRRSMAAAADPRTGRIYVFGGRDQDGRLLNEIVEYAPSMGSIGLSLPRLPSGRFNLAATANATTGTIFCVGGEALNVFRLDEILEFQTQTQPQTVKLQVGDTGDGTAALANSWNVFSSRNFKRNIQTLAPDELANVLAKVQATDVVRYVSKNDHQNTPRLGVIAEESPKEILGPGGKSISLSDYNAFLLAAIKAQQAEIEKNEEQIDALGTRFRELKKSKAESSGLGLDGSHPWLTALLLLVATVIFWQDWKRNPRPWSRSMMLLLAAAIVATALTASHAQQFDLSWYSIDGGGVIGSTDGQFTMSSTIGQPDAGAVMTGGGFEMIGGFWAGAGPSCACVSDLNADGLRNGGDIQDFIECLLTAGPNCTCADVRTDGILDLTDVEQFVGTLLDGSSCP